jgi:hypothetical protein
LLDSIFYPSRNCQSSEKALISDAWSAWAPVSPLHLVIPLPSLIAGEPTILEDESKSVQETAGTPSVFFQLWLEVKT